MVWGQGDGIIFSRGRGLAQKIASGDSVGIKSDGYGIFKTLDQV